MWVLPAYQRPTVPHMSDREIASIVPPRTWVLR